MEKTSKKFDFVSFITESFMFILACLLKPITSIKSKINEYADVKNAGLLVILVSLCRMIIGLLSAMITAIFVKQRNLFKGTTSLEVSFDGLKELDYPIGKYRMNTMDTLLIFTDKGNYLYLPVYEIPEMKWKDLGKHVSNLIPLLETENVIASLPVYDFNAEIYITTFTKDGMIKRTKLD